MREKNLKSYLLGTSSEPERTAIDRGLLTNDEEFEQVLRAEDDLIEAYLRQELSALEQTQFEQCFLADPERQQKLRLALALRRYANDPTKSSPDKVKAVAASTVAASWWAVLRRPVWQWATACGLLVVALLSIRAVFNSAEPTQIAHSSPSPTMTIAPAPVPTGTAVLPVELFPGQTRAVGTNPKDVRLSPGHGTVQFKLLLLKGPYPSYEVILIADDEAPRKLAGQFQPQTAKIGSYLIVPIPVTALENGGYRIKLEGITPQGTEKADNYAFTVKR